MFYYFYRTRIENFDVIPSLRDYMRLTGDFNEAAIHQTIYSTFPIVLPTLYYVIDVIYTSNLQECFFGYYYNGFECKSDATALRSQLSPSLPIADLNASATGYGNYHFGFFFRLTGTMLQNTGSDLILLQSAPVYGGRRFLQFYVDSSTQLIFDHAGEASNFQNLISLTGTYPYTAGRWYYIYKRYNPSTSENNHYCYLIDHEVLLQLQTIATSPTYALDSSLKHTIYLGQAPPIQSSKFDPYFSIKDFFIDINPDQLFSVNQAWYHPRNRFAMIKIAEVYLGFNESSGQYIGDMMRPDFQLNLRAGSNRFVWEWDPYVPRLCQGPYEIYNSYQQADCQGDEDQILVQDLFDNTLNYIFDTTIFSMDFWLRLDVDLINLPKTNVFVMNPTQPSAQITFSANQDHIPYVILQTIHDVQLHGFNFPGAFTCQCLNTWCMISFIKNGRNYYFDCNTENQAIFTIPLVGATNFPFLFDEYIIFGTVRPGYEILKGAVKDFKFYPNFHISFNQLWKDFTIKSPFAVGLRSYYSFDVNPLNFELMNQGQQYLKKSYQRTAASWPSLRQWAPYDNGKIIMIKSVEKYIYQMEWVYRYNSTALMERFYFPVSDQWTFEMRFGYVERSNVELIYIPYFLLINKGPDGILIITLGTNAIVTTTAALVGPNSWYHLVIICKSAPSTTSQLYIDGIYSQEINQRANLPNIYNPIDWRIRDGYAAIKDLRIWQEAMPLHFLKDVQLKIMDGSYYTQLFYYWYNRYTPDMKNVTKKYRSTDFSLEKTNTWGYFQKDELIFCDVYQIYDGSECNIYRYVHLDGDDFYNIQLPLNIANTVKDITVEFWVLFQKTFGIGDIVTLVDPGSRTLKLYEESATRLIKHVGSLYSVSPQFVYNRASSSTISFADTYWKKIIIQLSGTTTISLKIIIDTFQYGPISSANYPKPILKQLLFCQSTCNYALAYIMVWNINLIYSDQRKPPIIPYLSNLMAYWSLTEGSGNFFYDKSPKQLSYPIQVFHSNQNFRWKHPHQITKEANYLFVCTDSVTQYNSETNLCESLNVEALSFYASNNPVVLDSNQIQTYSKDWTIEFWLKFYFKFQSASTSLNLLTQINDGICYSDPSALLFRTQITKQADGSFRLVTGNFTGTSPINQNLNLPLKPGKYFHVALVNSGQANNFTSYLNHSFPIITNPAFSYLSDCKIALGKASGVDSLITFSFKHLRVWSEALPMHYSMFMSMATLPKQGYPNLILYYRFDNQYFVEYDYMGHLAQNSYLKWDFKPFIEKYYQDKDYSFTVFLITSCWNREGLLFNQVDFGDLFQLIWANGTYIINLKLKNSQIVSVTSQFQSYREYWFFTYNLEEKQISIIQNYNPVYSLDLNLDETYMRKFEDITNWIANVGYIGLNSEYVETGIKQLEIFRPYLSLEETRIITRKNQASHFKNSFGLQGGLRVDVNYLLLNTMFYASFYSNNYDLVRQDFYVESAGYRSFQPFEESCALGSQFRGGQCIEFANLMFQNYSLALTTSLGRVGATFTCQGWYNIISYGGTDEIIYMNIQDIFDLKYSSTNGMQLIIKNLTVNTHNVINFSFQTQKWIHLVVTFQYGTWKIYANNNQIFIQNDPSFTEFLSVSFNQFVIQSNHNKTLIKTKEVAMFGHARDIKELKSDFGTQISKVYFYNQLIFYYPMNEAGFPDLTDRSKFSRFQRIGNALGTQIFWDFDASGSFAEDLAMISQDNGKGAYLTKDKSLFFEGTMSMSNYATLGYVPNIGPKFTISFYIAFKNLLSISGTQYLMGIQQLMNIQVSNTNFYCQIQGVSSFMPIGIDPSLGQKWIGLMCGASSEISSSYFYNMTNEFKGVENYNNYPITEITASNRTLIIYSCNAYIKYINVYKDLIEPSFVLKYSRQTFNMETTSHPIIFQLTLEENFGNQVYETMTQQYFMIANNGNSLVSWQKPPIEIITCKGYSRYIISNDYCMHQEKFLKFAPNTQFQVLIQDQPMINSTTMVWLLFKSFGSTLRPFNMALEHRYYLEMRNQGSIYLFVANQSTRAFIREDAGRITYQNWALYSVRIVANQTNAYYAIGLPNYQDDFFTDIELTSSVYVNKSIQFQYSPAGYNFIMQFGPDTQVFVRNLQLWNIPLTIDSVRSRAIRGINPYRFKDTLVLYFRFDESGGNVIYNLADYSRRSSPKLITDINRQFFAWQYYSQINSNSANEKEDKRNFLFCLEPYSRKVNKHCEHCNPRCQTCIYAYDTLDCPTCTSLFYLYNRRCGEECPPFEHFDAGKCICNFRLLIFVECTQPLCKCTLDQIDDCFECKDSSHFYIAKDRKCITSCGKNQYYDPQLQACMKCHSFCDGCNGPSNSNCTKCRPPYQILNGACGLLECPPDNYIVNNTCKPCEPPCSSCSGSATNCTRCEEGFAFDSFNICTKCVDLEGYTTPWYINLTNPGGASCTEICGDGINFGFHECDDGNRKNKDGCNFQCKLENLFTCDRLDFYTSDQCQDNSGPSFIIYQINSDNTEIQLEFSEKCNSTYTSFSKDDFIVIITGTNDNTNLKYDLSATVTKSLSKKGALNLKFNQKFSVDEPNQVEIEVRFKNPGAITDLTGNILSKTNSQKAFLNKKTYIDEDQENQIKKNGQNLKSASTASLLTNALISLVLGKALDKIWIAMNACQIIYFMPLMSIPYPKTLKLYLKFLEFSNGEDDWLPEPFFYSYLNLKELQDKPINDAFKDYEYSQSIFILNYSKKINALMLIILAYPLILFCSIVIKHRYFDFTRRLEKAFRFNMLWRIAIEVYLELTLMAFMNFHALYYKTKTQYVSSMVAMGTMAITALLPALTLSVIQNNGYRLKSKEFEETHGELVVDTKIEEGKILHQGFIPIFLFRRLLYVIILVFLKDYPYVQVTLCVLKTFACCGYFVIVLPFESTLINFQQIMNEALTGIAFGLSYIFTSDLSEESKDAHFIETVKMAFGVLKNLKIRLSKYLQIVKDMYNQRYMKQSKPDNNIKSETLQNFLTDKSAFEKDLTDNLSMNVTNGQLLMKDNSTKDFTDLSINGNFEALQYPSIRMRPRKSALKKYSGIQNIAPNPNQFEITQPNLFNPKIVDRANFPDLDNRDQNKVQELIQRQLDKKNLKEKRVRWNRKLYNIHPLQQQDIQFDQ